MTKTYSAKPSDVARQWYLIDAATAPVGRVATLAATYLIGKQKPQFTYHIDCGDGVIIINAAKLKLTGNKLETKSYYRHSGYPGSIKETTAREMMAKDPSTIIRLAVSGMLPSNKLTPARLARLKIYPGAEHDQSAQQPITLEVTHAR